MENKTFDLGDVLAAPVNVAAAPVMSDEVFDTEMGDEIVQPVNEPVEDQPIIDDPQFAMPPNHLAETIVGMLDGLQSSLIPLWRKKSMFTAKELEILDNMDTTGGHAYLENSPEFKILLKWKKHMSICEKMPFTLSEKERLVNATARYCATMQIQVSPFTGLLMAFGEVAATRFVYIISE
jgi:hypothetical protein